MRKKESMNVMMTLPDGTLVRIVLGTLVSLPVTMDLEVPAEVLAACALDTKVSDADWAAARQVGPR